MKTLLITLLLSFGLFTTNAEAEKPVENLQTEVTTAIVSCGPSYAVLQRGPRGGCYYVNKNGNKSYVSRSCCD